MPDMSYGTAPNALGNLIEILDQAKGCAHSIRILENKIHLTQGELKEAERKLEEFQKKSDSQNRFLRIISSFWMALVLVLVGIVLSVAVMIGVLYAVLVALVAIGELLLIIFLFLILLFWNNTNTGLYLGIAGIVLAAVAVLIYFLVLVACLFATFALRNLLMNRARKKIRESERLFPSVSTKIEQLHKDLNKLEYEKKEEEQYLNSFLARHPGIFSAIPAHLIREDALSFLSSVLRDGQATDIEGAVALYERKARLYHNEDWSREIL